MINSDISKTSVDRIYDFINSNRWYIGYARTHSGFSLRVLFIRILINCMFLSGNLFQQNVNIIRQKPFQKYILNYTLVVLVQFLCVEKDILTIEIRYMIFNLKFFYNENSVCNIIRGQKHLCNHTFIIVPFFFFFYSVNGGGIWTFRPTVWRSCLKMSCSRNNYYKLKNNEILYIWFQSIR